MQYTFSYLSLVGSLLGLGHATPLNFFGGGGQIALQEPLSSLSLDNTKPVSRLRGRFLHITDLHPDPFYKSHTSTDQDNACHRGHGSAGFYGAETSDCDTPFALINATFKWIAENIKDEVDFVVWTGDSSRHDSDERVPRTAAEIISTNSYVAAKFAQTFGNGLDPTDHKHDMLIPVIPTFGNNDFLPHNIFFEGPNKWLKQYSTLWDKFLPEEQRHSFQRGGWFYVEAIPNKLTVFSLNTMYFFSHNAAVNGCAAKNEPGFEHMEWLRAQLQIMRDRGMKVILTGHVPPARTDSKELWDETCWQKYTLYLKQFRDVVIAGLYGHMNIDHFMLQDTKEIDLEILSGQTSQSNLVRSQMDEELTTSSATDYLEELRENWSELPKIPTILRELSNEYVGDGVDADSQRKKGNKSKKKHLDKIGGPWGERFQVTNVGTSIVPNYFPALRIFEYNITGLESVANWADQSAKKIVSAETELIEEKAVRLSLEVDSMGEGLRPINDDTDELADTRKNTGKKHKKEKPKKPDVTITIPSPPAKDSPPGPAYSPQALTLIRYTQYFANITRINNDMALADRDHNTNGDIDTDRWHDGKYKDQKPKDPKSHPKKFEFEVEYDTFSDKIYKLKDLTVTSYLRLAYRMSRYKPEKGDSIEEKGFQDTAQDLDESKEPTDEGKKGKKDRKHKKKKHNKQHERNKVWLAFFERAFVSTQGATYLPLANEDSASSSESSEARTTVDNEQDLRDGDLALYQDGEL